MKGFKSPLNYKKMLEALGDAPSTPRKEFTAASNIAEQSVPPNFTLEGSPYSKEGILVGEPTGAPYPKVIKPQLPDIEIPASDVTDLSKQLALTSPSSPGMFNNMSGGQIAAMGALGGGAVSLAAILGLPEEELAAQAPIQQESKALPPSTLKQLAPSLKPETKSDIKSAAQEETSQPTISREQNLLNQYRQMMEEAQDKDRQRNLLAGLMQAGEQIGAGIARTKPEYTGSAAVRGLKNEVENVNEKYKAQGMDAQVQDLMDENQLRDKDSESSKMARDVARTLGIKVSDDTTAMQLQKAGLPLGTLLSSKMSADARKETAALMKETKDEARKETSDFKAQASVDKQTNTLLKSKDYESYNLAKDAQVALKNAIGSKNKTDAGAAFMQFAKNAQGDNSVVRDGDMRVLAGGWNFTSPQDMLTKLHAKAKGGDFNEKELQQMQKVVETAANLKKARLSQQINPILTRMEAHKLNPSETFDPSFIEEFKGTQVKETTKSKPIAKKQYSPSANKTKIVYADGTEEILDGRQ